MVRTGVTDEPALIAESVAAQRKQLACRAISYLIKRMWDDLHGFTPLTRSEAETIDQLVAWWDARNDGPGCGSAGAMDPTGPPREA